MFLFIICSIACCLTSLLIHLNTFVHFFNPTNRLLMTVGFWSFLILIYPNTFELKGITRGLNKTDYKKVILDTCPRWMMFTFGVLLFYALANATYYFIFRQSGHLPISKGVHSPDIKMRTLSSLLLASHFSILTLLYNLRYLKKYGHPLIDSE